MSKSFQIYVEVDTNDCDYAGNLIEATSEYVEAVVDAFNRHKAGIQTEGDEDVLWEIVPKGDWSEHLDVFESIEGIKILEVTNEIVLRR